MASGFWSGLKRFILWDYPRAGWQYDVMVGMILAFIFLTPKAWFRDQPRPSTVVMLQAHDNKDVFWIAPELLASVPENQREARAGDLVRERYGKRLQLVRMETIFDAESEIRGYMCWSNPDRE